MGIIRILFLADTHLGFDLPFRPRIQRRRSLVPGNHERSAIPYRHLAEHPGIYIFDRPQTYLWCKDDFTLALAGFPFIQINLHPADMDAAKLRSYLKGTLYELPQDGIVRLKIHGRISQAAMAVLRAASLRSLAPPTMNIDTAFKDYNFF
jgi:hypothetical protein